MKFDPTDTNNSNLENHDNDYPKSFDDNEHKFVLDDASVEVAFLIGYEDLEKAQNRLKTKGNS